MKIIEATTETKAAPEHVWARYEDVKTWKDWDHGIEHSSLENGFVAGSKGVLKPKGAPASRFVLTAVDRRKGFSDRTRLPLTNLDFEHVLEPTAAGTRITHRATFSGPLAFLFSRIIGKKIAEGMPTAVKTLARLAEQGARS